MTQPQDPHHSFNAGQWQRHPSQPMPAQQPQPYPQQYPPGYGYPQPPPQKRRRALPWILAGGLLAVAGIAVTLVIVLMPSGITVRGTMILLGGAGPGYSDIHDGAQVEVVNGRRDVIATGGLRAEDDTLFTFEIPDVPTGEGRYGVAIGRDTRGVIWMDEDQVNDQDELIFMLSLGAPEDAEPFG